jgi:hypothetical protein
MIRSRTCVLASRVLLSAAVVGSLPVTLREDQDFVGVSDRFFDGTALRSLLDVRSCVDGLSGCVRVLLREETSGDRTGVRLSLLPVLRALELDSDVESDVDPLIVVDRVSEFRDSGL